MKDNTTFNARESDTLPSHFNGQSTILGGDKPNQSYAPRVANVSPFKKATYVDESSLNDRSVLASQQYQKEPAFASEIDETMERRFENNQNEDFEESESINIQVQSDNAQGVRNLKQGNGGLAQSEVGGTEESMISG